VQLTESAWCSSLRVRGWWMLTMNSHGVEFSIAGCVREMVRETTGHMIQLFGFSAPYFLLASRTI